MKGAAFFGSLLVIAIAIFVSLCLNLSSSGGVKIHGHSPVILIVIDTLRADRLSQYGYELDTSPGLDDFVSHATVFENCYSDSPWTRPSMATIFTGVHPIKHGIVRGTKMKNEVVTLAEVLEGNRLETAGVTLNPNVTRKTGMDQGFTYFEEILGSRTTAYKNADEMFESIERWHEGAHPSFFLFALPMNVHGPYRVPEEHRSVLLGRPPAKGFKYFGSVMKDIMVRGKVEEGRARFTPTMRRSLEEKYANAVRYTTDRIGEFFEYLKKKGDYERSLIIVTADHGEELYDHMGMGHGFTLFDELLHVPLIVKLPGQSEGRRVETRVGLKDILPTVLDVLELEPVEGIDGVSFAGLLEGKTDENGTRAEREIATVSWSERCVGSAFYDEPWKLIHIEADYEGRFNEKMLFNLQVDPDERSDVSGDNPVVVERMYEALVEGSKKYSERSSADFSSRAEMDSEMEDQLRALGYIH